MHCIVPNGGLVKEGDTFKWQFPKRGKSNFLFPVAAMNKLYKGFFLSQLKAAIEQGELQLPPSFPFGKKYKIWKNALYKKEWVVYTKKPFAGVKKVVNYLARYSHRVALTNHRIKNMENGRVVFEYKDYKDEAKKKLMNLSGTEFLRRFCLHILPHGFRKIRQYGFCSNASKSKLLQQARLALGEKLRQLLTRKERKEKALNRLFGEKENCCPCCEKGIMVGIYSWEVVSKKTKNKSPPPFYNRVFTFL